MTPRPRRGHRAETSRGDAAAATWKFSRDRRAPQVPESPGRRLRAARGRRRGRRGVRRPSGDRTRRFDRPEDRREKRSVSSGTAARKATRTCSDGRTRPSRRCVLAPAPRPSSSTARAARARRWRPRSSSSPLPAQNESRRRRGRDVARPRGRGSSAETWLVRWLVRGDVARPRRDADVRSRPRRRYLAAVGGQGASFDPATLLATTPVLEAFGNAKTAMNDNSSRFGKFLVLDFDAETRIRGARVEDFLLEKSRVTTCSPDERTYHAFYQVAALRVGGVGAADDHARVRRADSSPTRLALGRGSIPWRRVARGAGNWTNSNWRLESRRRNRRETRPAQVLEPARYDRRRRRRRGRSRGDGQRARGVRRVVRRGRAPAEDRRGRDSTGRRPIRRRRRGRRRGERRR